MYYFLSGYTAKVAGTEKGIKEPQATFSTCFGGPFMVHHPMVYANLLREKIEKHGSRCWLVNTGWTGGPYGVGSRIKISYTRAMIESMLKGDLDKVSFIQDQLFELRIPQECPGVPAEILQPRNTWPSSDGFDVQALKLATMFKQNFSQFADAVTEEVLKAGPKI